MNKLIIIIIVILIVAAGIGAYFVFQKPAFSQPPQNPCGDGICDEFEKAHPNLCPQDCKQQPTIQPTAIPPQIGKCGDGICDDFEKANPNLCPKDCGETDAGSVIKSIKVSSPILPFVSVGDLWLSTWADDDSVFVSWGDGLGPNPQTREISYSSHGLAKLNGTFPDITAEVANRFMPLSDKAYASKSSSLLFYNGRLYAAIHSPQMHPNMGFITYSDDYGKSFKYDTNSPWTTEKNSKFICLMFINMGKGYNLNKDGYVYALGIGSEVDWNGPVYLSRVKKEDILDYSAWEYFSGLDKANNPEWSNNQYDAVVVPGLTTKDLFSSIYHPGIKRYIAMTAEITEGKIFTAPNPWGPWTFAGKWFEGTASEWVGSYMPGIIPKDTGENSFYFAGPGVEQPVIEAGQAVEMRYRFRLGKITLDVSE